MARMTIIGQGRAEQNMQQRASNQRRSSRSVIRKIMTLYFQVVAKNFNTSGGGHKPPKRWRPLAKSTAKQKAKLGFSSRPLIRSGRLRQEWALKATRNRGTLTSTAASKKGVLYATFHEKGTKRIPKRKILPTIKHASQIARRTLGAQVKFNIETT